MSSSQGFAQQGSQEQTQRSVPGGLEEIVVTAERGEDQLQKVGQAIEAFTPEELEVRGIEDVHGLSFNTPNFVMTSGLAQPSLRGISNDVVATGIESGLALHINNVFVPGLHVASIFELFDMKGVEILYGPQGTLFGRATDGGTINYITQTPTFNEWEAWADADIDTLEKVQVRAVLNVPVIDERLAFRFGINREWPQHTYRADSMAGHIQDLETAWSGHGSSYRASVRWRATDNLMVDAMVNWVRNNSNGGATSYTGPFSNGAYPGAYTPETFATLTGIGADYAAAAAAAGIAPGTLPSAMTPAQLDAVRPFRRSTLLDDNSPILGVENGFFQTCDNAKLAAVGLGTHNQGSRTPCEGVWGDPTPNPSDPYKLRHNRRQSQRYDQMVSILKLEYSGENYTLTSTTSYQELDFIIDRDDDHTDMDIRKLMLEYEEDSIGQELLYQASFGDFDVVAGTNYTYYHQPDLRVPIWDYQRNAEFAEYLVLDAFTFLPHVWGGAAGGPVTSIFQPMPAAIPSILDIDTETHAQYFGVFGNLTWHATDRLTLRGGVRYSSTRREMLDATNAPVTFTCNSLLTDVIAPGLSGDDACTGLFGLDPATTRFMTFFTGPLSDPANPTAFQEYHVKETWKSITWEARGEYQITDENMVFLRLSQAEAPGGINYWWRGNQFDPSVDLDETVDEQKTLAVEFGSKNRFFDNRLQVNVAAFWYDYEDKLIEVPARGASGVVTAFDNVPDSELMGGELSIIALPTPELLVNLKVGYIHAEYDSDYFIAEDALDAACPIARNGSGVIGCDTIGRNINGLDIPRAPEWTVNLGVAYTFEFDWGRITPRVDFTWKDDYNLAPYDTDAAFQKSYSRTAARIRYERLDGKYWVEVYGDNLNDAVIRNQQEFRASMPAAWLYPPRHFGIKVGYQFM